MSKFQVILLAVFGAFILVAVFVFSVYRSSSGQEVRVTVWGTFSIIDFNNFLNRSALSRDNSLTINYVEKSPATIETDFTEALAQGTGPDLIILRQDAFWKNKNKLVPIPYANFNERNFTQTFIEAGEIYLTEEGVYALPLLSDPLILYYNRDKLSNAGIAKPIEYWDEIYATTVNLTRRDPAGNLTQSTIALGETRNINNAKEIISLLFLQAGTPITDFFGSNLRSFLDNSFNLPVAPAHSALEFYTQFANPTKSFYSWNRNLPEAQTRFASGDSAYYLGFTSELRALRNKNPTLNFAVASVPQSRVSNRNLTYGRLHAVSITRGTKNPSAALMAALKLSNSDSVSTLSQITLLPPARRDLLALKPTDSIWPVFYLSALQAESWIDPDTVGSARVFSEMVESVTSGRAKVSEAVNEADQELEALIRN